MPCLLYSSGDVVGQTYYTQKAYSRMEISEGRMTMYFLNYLENSDAACQSSTTPHAHFQDCARQMHDEFEEVRKSLGIRAEDLPEPSEDCETGIFSGYLDVWTAYLRKNNQICHAY